MKSFFKTFAHYSAIALVSCIGSFHIRRKTAYEVPVVLNTTTIAMDKLLLDKMLMGKKSLTWSDPKFDMHFEPLSKCCIIVCICF